MQVRDLTPRDWLGVAALFEDQSFEQTLTYSEAATRRIGGQMRLISVEAGGQPVAAACLRVKTVPGLGRGIGWIASGPLTKCRDVPSPDASHLSAILAALRDDICYSRGHLLRIRLPALAFHAPETIARAMAAAGFHQTERAFAYRSAAIGLTREETRLMADLNGKWRTDLRFAQKSDLVLEMGDDAAMQARFLALFETVQTAKGFSTDITPEFHFALSGPDYRRDILLATKDGIDLAGIVIGTTGTTATYLFGATVDAGRPLRAGYFLTWEGIRLSRERGLLWYDLGGIDAGTNPDVARFKERMNGVPLVAHAFEADAGGPLPSLIRRLESLRSRLRRT